jgi:hypothetical protein
VWYIATNGDLIEFYQAFGGRWFAIDHSPAYLPALGLPLVGYTFDEGSSERVAYIAADGHIHEHSAQAGGFWADADLTKDTSGLPPAVGSPLAGYGGGWPFWTHINSEQVDYIGADGHVYDLYNVLGSDWTPADLKSPMHPPQTEACLLATTGEQGH